MNTDEMILIDVETFCPVKRRMVRLTLRCRKPQHGRLVTGKPFSCNYEEACSKEENSSAKYPFRCYLNCLQITTNRADPITITKKQDRRFTPKKQRR